MLNDYKSYLEVAYPKLKINLSPEWDKQIELTNWDEPESSIELNNVAVMAFVEAEAAEDIQTKNLYLEIAFNMLNSQIEDVHPLQRAHLALFYLLMDEKNTAINLAFSSLIDLMQPLYDDSVTDTPGLIYLPFYKKLDQGITIKKIVETNNGNEQAFLMCLEIIKNTPIFFYNNFSQRLLKISLAIEPTSFEHNFRIGLCCLVNCEVEGIYYLQKANKLKREMSEVIQSLYLAYKDLQLASIAEYWHQMGKKSAKKVPEWTWTELPVESSFTYTPFEDYLMAVQASLRSIVTIVMLAEGDWGESELKFWRNMVSEGMTVIDVGANVGVYSLSAASRVGESGKVIAIEPFSLCVKCLEESCRINNLSWVKVYASAASSIEGTGFLSLKNSNELNEIVTEKVEDYQEGVEEITFITLDSLIVKENLQQVDWLKIDAEGHEIQVLLGSLTMIERFSPNILYENIAGDKGFNQEVAEFLQGKGYKLFRYRSYLEELIPIESLNDLQGVLNIIAIAES